jgi:hypothetical protein
MYDFGLNRKGPHWRRVSWHLMQFVVSYFAIALVVASRERRPESRHACSLPTCVSAAVPSVAIVVPFTTIDFQKAVDGVRRWSILGDPCPGITVATQSPLHVLFWFNRDLEQEPLLGLGKLAQSAITHSLQPVQHCISSVSFGSARLTDDEDPYPFGASNMFYKLYVAESDPLRPFDYFLWAEQDLTPVRSGWMDALIVEVALHQPFFVRGSIHRGSNLDELVKRPSEEAWVTHINGNAIYSCHDTTFRAMVKACYNARASKGIHASFDLAIWMTFVSNHQNTRTWKRYQNYAHKFQYTDFMQNHGYAFPGHVVAHVLERSPSTYMIHGDPNSAGARLMKQRTRRKSHKSRFVRGG